MPQTSDSCSLVFASALAGNVALKQVTSIDVSPSGSSEVVTTLAGPQGTKRNRGGHEVTLSSRRARTTTPEVDWDRHEDEQVTCQLTEDYPGAQRFVYTDGVVSTVNHSANEEGEVMQEVVLVFPRRKKTR